MPCAALVLFCDIFFIYFISRDYDYRPLGYFVLWQINIYPRGRYIVEYISQIPTSRIIKVRPKHLKSFIKIEGSPQPHYEINTNATIEIGHDYMEMKLLILIHCVLQFCVTECTRSCTVLVVLPDSQFEYEHCCVRWQWCTTSLYDDHHYHLHYGPKVDCHLYCKTHSLFNVQLKSV